jgi:outer membrane lipoprotein LolB
MSRFASALTAVGRVAGVWILSVLMAACTSIPPRAGTDGSTFWSGRLALTVDGEPPQQFSAGFDLRGDPESGELVLNSPLGNSLASVRWTPGSAEWVQGGQTTRRSTLERLTTDLGGAALPVEALFAWLRGEDVPIPGWTADLSRHDQGRIVARRLQPLPTAELRIVFEP